MADALYLPDGDRFLPTQLTAGPWSPDAQHGGPVAALVVRAIERHEAGDFLAARLTLELLRPVPLAPLAVRTRTTRPGRKVQLVEAHVEADGVEVARATGLRIRRAPVVLPEGLPPSAPAPAPGPEDAVRHEPWGGWEGFHNAGAELRFASGGFFQPGPATAWIRLTVPVVAGEAPTGAMRAAAAADFGNGISSVLPFGTWVFINPDLTVSLHREPVGEWICLRARTTPTSIGVGLAEGDLFDVDGAVGRSQQSLVVEPAR